MSPRANPYRPTMKRYTVYAAPAGKRVKRPTNLAKIGSFHDVRHALHHALEAGRQSGVETGVWDNALNAPVARENPTPKGQPYRSCMKCGAQYLAKHRRCKGAKLRRNPCCSGCASGKAACGPRSNPGGLPASLRPFAGLIAEAWHEDDDFDGPGGSWWVALKPGYETGGDERTIHEKTLARCVHALRGVTKV